MKKQSSRTVAFYGILIALALVLSWAEAQIPVFFAVPGMKLGLTNVVVLFALYCLGAKSALFINLVRIVLVSFLFGNGVSVLYGLAGGLLSGMVMILLKKTGKVHIVTVSIAGGISHNVGQILVAMAMLETARLAWYLMILWLTGLATGAVIGLIGGELCKRLNRIIKKNGWGR